MALNSFFFLCFPVKEEIIINFRPKISQCHPKITSKNNVQDDLKRFFLDLFLKVMMLVLIIFVKKIVKTRLPDINTFLAFYNSFTSFVLISILAQKLQELKYVGHHSFFAQIGKSSSHMSSCSNWGPQGYRP